MLCLFHSNRLENLLKHCVSILGKPVSDPFIPETIVVQNPGMARWVVQKVALQTGIGANLEFPLPARFIHRIFESQFDSLPVGMDFKREVLLWRIYSLLPGLADQPGFEEVGRYLVDDLDGRKLYQLAGKISDIFDQYLVYRPEMLAQWEDGREEHWQARLWRLLTSSGEYHRGRLFRDFFQLSERGKLHRNDLPQRVFIFGVGTLAPVYLQVIHAISHVIDIHLFFLNPCREYWGDLLSKRAKASMRARWRRSGKQDLSRYYNVGNPLLASLGVQGREFFEQLTGLELVEKALFHKVPPRDILSTVQGDILELIYRQNAADNTLKVAKGDKSIQLHICHSTTREVQVLHDRLLEMFETVPELSPRDIIVMAPQITEYATAVTSVFETTERTRYIPWALADRPVDSTQPVIRGFQTLLDIVTGRYPISEILSLLEISAIQNRFNLDDESMIRLRTWIDETGIRWGLDQEHRKEAGFDDSSLHTLEFGINRLMLGYSMAGDDLYKGIAPFPVISGDDATCLGEFAAFVEELRVSRKLMITQHNANGWQDVLLSLLDTFFLAGDSSDDEEALALLREKILDFSQQVAEAGQAEKCDISLSVIQDHFKNQLQKPMAGYAFLSGRVTFCNMVPMRAIPFKVICLLGMNDTDYPRIQQTPSFDLIRQEPRIGDRCRRDDDRYLFLEALLSAREIFYISWVGRNIRDNSERVPSVVVSELCDYLDSAFTAGNKKTSDSLTILYPLQPFSRLCFGTHATYQSYSSQWLPSTPTSEDPSPAFIKNRLPLHEISSTISIKQLATFWNHPVRFFLTERLGLHLYGSETEPGDTEPFSLNFLEQYQLNRELLANRLKGRSDTLASQLRARGELPHGEFGRNTLHNLEKTSLKLIQALEPLIQAPKEILECRINVSDYEITGSMDHLFSEGRVVSRPAKVKAKDYLSLWIYHLILNSIAPAGIQLVSIHVGTDKKVQLNPVAEPIKEIQRLVEYYQQGYNEPLHFYPETSLAWAKAKPESRSKAAAKIWHGGYISGEKEATEYRIALSGREPLDSSFCQCAEIFFPLLDHLEMSTIE